MNELLENLVKSIEEKVYALDEKHAAERLRLMRMDVIDIKSMMPELIIFHQNVREEFTREKESRNDIPVRTVPSVAKNTINQIDSDECDVDMPMDYKVSDLDARPDWLKMSWLDVVFEYNNGHDLGFL